MFFSDKCRIPVKYDFEITIVNFHWNNRILCIFCRGKNRKSCIYLQQYWRNTNKIEYHVSCDKYFILAQTETDRLWFGQEIRSDFLLFINKNVAKSRVALPGIMAGPVNDHTETYVLLLFIYYTCTSSRGAIDQFTNRWVSPKSWGKNCDMQVQNSTSAIL